MGAFNNTTQVTVMTVDELKERMGALGDRITEAQEAIDNFGDEFESSLIEGKQNQLNALLDLAAQIATSYDRAVTQAQKDWINKQYHDVNVAINELLEDIEKINGGFSV